MRDRLRLTIELPGALRRGDTLCRILVHGVREGGAWEPLADGVGPEFNAGVHAVRWQVRTESDQALELELTAEIRPDPWVPGGKAAWQVQLRRDGAGWTGSYAGSFTPSRLPAVPVSGPATASEREPFTVTGARTAGEPELLTAWRRDGARGALGDWRRCGELADAGGGVVPERIFRAVDHGARPDSGRDATTAIQAAIAACAAAGGGVVELPPGRLDLAIDRDDTCLEIAHDRVLLRGAGSGPDGTLIYAHRPGRADDRRKPWRAGRFPRLAHLGPAPATVMEDTPPDGVVTARLAGGERRGDRALRLVPGSTLAPGVYRLEQHDPEDLSLGEALTTPSLRRAANWRKPGRAVVCHYVRVTAVSGLSAELDAPLPFAVEARWQPHLRRLPLIVGSGVSGLRFATAWDSVFEHHRDDVHDNGWDGIRCDQVAGCTIEDVVFESVTTAASLKDAFACRMADCRISGNPGHNGFGLGGSSTRCLLLRLRFGRAMHAVNMNGTIAQNAIVDCEGDEPSGIDFHGSAGIDTLIDRLTGCVCTGGGSDANVPPRHGPGLVFWNWRCGTFHPYAPLRPLTCVADAREMSGFIVVGAHGRRPLHVLDHEGRVVDADAAGAWGTVVSLNRPVAPASLWAAQRAAAD
jgi:hypothetical protein